MARHERPDVVKGIAAGLVGGLAATAVMTLVQNTMRAALRDEDAERESDRAHERRAGGAEKLASTATERAAVRATRALTGKRLRGKAKSRASTGVHYGFGTLAGGTYGATAEMLPKNGIGTDALEGIGFGSGVWLLGDEVAVPALGLAPPPWETGPWTHAYSLAGHLVYGATLGLVTRAMRRLLS